MRFHFTLCRYFLGHFTCRNLPWQGLATRAVSFGVKKEKRAIVLSEKRKGAGLFEALLFSHYRLIHVEALLGMILNSFSLLLMFHRIS